VSASHGGVYACSCLERQRCTGTAFSYRAIYTRRGSGGATREDEILAQGRAVGRLVGTAFLRRVRDGVFMGAEALKDEISASVGCLEDLDLPPPQMFHCPTGGIDGCALKA
jgi:hypothetical protein